MNSRDVRVRSVAVHGVDGHVVEIDARIVAGPPRFHIAGQLDDKLRESKDRVRAAVVNSGMSWPSERIDLTLSPAAPRLIGSSLDLALACAVLGANRTLPRSALDGVAMLGELGLDGRLRTVRGVLPFLRAARAAGMCRAIVPESVLAEARFVEGIAVYGAADLADVLDYLQGSCQSASQVTHHTALSPMDPAPMDLADIRAQTDAKRALEVAAAGGHHTLLVGPPGAGKTLLAQAFVGLLPSLSAEQALTLAAVQSVAGRLRTEGALSTVPPFVAPHHSSSMAALLGGGSGIARPGAVSLAHLGVLYLDFTDHVVLARVARSGGP